MNPPAVTPPTEPLPSPGAPRPPLRLQLPPRPVEHTRWSKGLLGFYASCAGVALGATFAASGWFFLRPGPWRTFWVIWGAVQGAVCAVTCFLSLAAARRAPPRG